jgi:hypothetical protein
MSVNTNHESTKGGKHEKASQNYAFDDEGRRVEVQEQAEWRPVAFRYDLS